MDRGKMKFKNLLILVRNNESQKLKALLKKPKAESRIFKA